MKSKMLAMMALIGLIAGLQAPLGHSSEHQMSPDTLKQLAQARRATAKYHNIDTAFAEGFIDVNFILPGVGCHLMNLGRLFDGTFIASEPEIVIYADCTPGQGGKAVLRAIEYAAPCGPPCTLPPPEGFTGDHDVWAVFNDELWTLHVWVWRNNPDGIFVKINPRIPQ